jgi:hypothetical protein
MSTFAELNAEIDSFLPVVTPCPGSEYPWRHFPERTRDGASHQLGIRCGCGKVFEGHAWQAPVTQPAPELWAAFQAFKGHVEQIKEVSHV